MKKLVFITTRLFWPANSGRKVSLYHYCKGLHELYGYEIYLYSFLEADQSKGGDKPKFIKEILYAKDIKKRDIACNLLTKSFSNLKWPLQCSAYYSKDNARQLERYCLDVKPDVIICDMLRLAMYEVSFRNLQCKKILDMDDLLSKRYKRQLNSKESRANITGQYGKRLPKYINKIMSGKVKDIILKMESQRCETAEIEFAKSYDSVIFVSPVETEEFNKKSQIEKAVTITIGCDCEYFSKQVVTDKISNSLSFVGNFEWPANVDSIEIIVNMIIPYIKTPVMLNVIGKCPDNVKDKFVQCKNVHFHGMVEDLRKNVQETEIFLAPIAYGSGIKTKIIEAMAMGMPIITNSVGAEGLGSMDDSIICVQDDYKQIAKKVDELLANEELRKLMSKNAQAYALQRYNWDDIYMNFEKVGL